MKIKVKDKSSNKDINITIPMWILTSGIKHADFITRISAKGIDPKSMAIINSIDFKIIARNFKDLKKYKGLRLVEVKGKDGDEVIIEI